MRMMKNIFQTSTVYYDGLKNSTVYYDGNRLHEYRNVILVKVDKMYHILKNVQGRSGGQKLRVERHERLYPSISIRFLRLSFLN